MRRTGLLLFLSPLLVASLVSWCDAGFHVTDKGVLVWEAPSEGWKVGGVWSWPMDKVHWLVENKPADVEGLKLFALMDGEPGEWLTFRVKFGRVQRVVFTRNTKIVVLDRKGKRYESEACFFYPDQFQTELYDTRRMAVVVTRHSVYCFPRDSTAGFTAKFAEGSIRSKDVVEFEVMGVVEDSTYQDVQ
jgi:hypothetical protein